MKDLESFYEYYSRELTYLRRQGSQFARKYPKIAQKLDFNAQESADPHVERLLESFAYLTAKLQKDVDDQFPRISSALLGVLYPQFTSPLPSVSIAEFILSPKKGKLSSLHKVPKETPLFVKAQNGQNCRFRTCYDLTLGPYELKSAEIIATEQNDLLSTSFTSSHILKLHLQSFGESFQSLALKKLRFFIEGSRLFKNIMYEALFLQNAKIGLILNSGDQNATFYPLSQARLAQVGFDAVDSILPYPDHAHPGYRLMFEYFHFPEKFYFFDIDHLSFPQNTRDITIIISLSDKVLVKSTDVSARNFRLHCTPFINLFPKTSEPINLDYKTHEYRLIADLKNEKYTEIHSIININSIIEGITKPEKFQPYFSYHHSLSAEDKSEKPFWFSRRTPSINPNFSGTDIFLSFIDQFMDPLMPASRTIYGQLLCTNRHLAHELPPKTTLQPENENPAAQIVCLYRPTLQYYPSVEGASQWRLISHLSLNYLSLSSSQDSLSVLKEMIHLYADTQGANPLLELESITKMEVTSVMRRFGLDTWRGFIKGTRLRLAVNFEKNSQRNLFLFATVLHHFYSLFTDINSFVELELYNQNNQETWKTWPPIAGNKSLL